MVVVVVVVVSTRLLVIMNVIKNVKKLYTPSKD